MEQSSNLTGKLLIAMPGMLDPRFERSVILVCSHSEDGAMGLVVNRPMPDIGFAHLLDQLGIETGENIIDIPVGFGGPVEPGRGFVLHRLDEVTDLEDPEGTLRIDAGLAMTSTATSWRILPGGRVRSRLCWRWAMQDGDRGSWMLKSSATAG